MMKSVAIRWRRLALSSIAVLATLSPALAASPGQEAAVNASRALVPSPPWPAGDERGMANTLGRGTWSRCAFHLAQQNAKTYEISHVRSNSMPLSPFGRPLAYEYTPSVSIPGTRHVFNGEQVKGGEPGAQGTQMDAIGHFAYYDKVWDGQGMPPADTAKYYGGFTQKNVKPTPDSPLLKLGIEKVPPIITTAVLLDARSHMGKVEPGALIGASDIEAMLKAQKLEWRGILPGDVVYIYTGWGDNWKDPDTEKSYYTMGPGLAFDGAKYLEDRAVVLVALDNPFTDPVAAGQLQQRAKPPQGMEQGLPFIIHHHNLTQAGVHQIQNANLGELARDKVWTSCTMILPLRSRGHAGSPVRPVAIGVPNQ